MATTPMKNIPRPTPDSEPFWRAAKDHRLIVQHCAACARLQFYPRRYCKYCFSEELDWQQVSGKGTIQTYTVIHRAPSAAYQADVPYALALVELDEGPIMMTNIVGVDPTAVRIGMPVRVVFEDLTEGISLPKFEPMS